MKMRETPEGGGLRPPARAYWSNSNQANLLIRLLSNTKPQRCEWNRWREVYQLNLSRLRPVMPCPAVTARLRSVVKALDCCIRSVPEPHQHSYSSRNRAAKQRDAAVQNV